MEQKAIQRAKEDKRTKPNLTGIPTQMKLDFEQRSGLSFDDVRIHYNSEKPAQLQALAYTQGTQVYVGPGQERHLPHELGHVVQQKLGLVRPTARVGDVLINDDLRLEREADAAKGNSSQRAVSLFPPVIQRSGDLSVGVSLRLQEDNMPRSPSEYVLDGLKIYGRSDTELKYNGRPTQGDHTIADVLVKKHQKVMTKSKGLDEAVAFYKTLFLEVRKHNLILRKNQLTPEEEKRRTHSQNDASFGIEMCDDMLKKNFKANVREMRRAFAKIVVEYNDAYSTSVFATFGHGTGGHGEAQAIDALKQIGTDKFKPQSVMPLLDLLSSVNLAGTALPKKGISEDALAIILNRFFAMLAEINQRKIEIRSSQPEFPKMDVGLAEEDAESDEVFEHVIDINGILPKREEETKWFLDINNDTSLEGYIGPLLCQLFAMEVLHVYNEAEDWEKIVSDNKFSEKIEKTRNIATKYEVINGWMMYYEVGNLSYYLELVDQFISDPSYDSYNSMKTKIEQLL